MTIDPRIRVTSDVSPREKKKYVLYWMHSTLRAHGNPALEEAIRWANQLELAVVVYGQPVVRGPQATERRAAFFLEAVHEVKERLRCRNIRFVLYLPEDEGAPPTMIHRLLHDCAALVADTRPFSPFRGPLRKMAKAGTFPIHLVDGAHIFPLNLLKKAKLDANLDDYVSSNEAASTTHDEIVEVTHSSLELELNFRDATLKNKEPIELVKNMELDHTAPAVLNTRGGLTVARRLLSSFIDEKLDFYPDCISDPSTEGTSGLSPYIAAGHIDAREIVQSVRSSSASTEARKAYLDHILLLRSHALSYNAWLPRNGVAALPKEAQEGLARNDFAGENYALTSVEDATTKDQLFNACQKELLVSGSIHPSLRLYWGRKILETAPTPEDALKRFVMIQKRWSLAGEGLEGFASLVSACASLGTPLPVIDDDAKTAYIDRMDKLHKSFEDGLKQAAQREQDAIRRRK